MVVTTRLGKAQSGMTYVFFLWFILIYGLVGFFMCRAYEQSESLLGAIALHFVYNCIAILLVL